MTLSFRKVLEIGTSPSLSRSEYKRTVLLNIICLSSFIFYALLILNDVYLLNKESGVNEALYQSHLQAFLLDLIMIGILSVTLLLNLWKKLELARWFYVLSTAIRSILFVNLVQPGQLFEYGFVSIPLFALLFLKKSYHQIIFLSIAIAATFFTLGRADLYQDGKSLDPVLLSFFFTGVFLAIKYFQSANQKSEQLLEKERNVALENAAIIKSQNEELKQLGEFKNHFFVNVSHELRTPLTLINGYAKKLHNSLGDEDRNQAKIILEESNQIKELIDNILDLSKLEDGSFNIQRQEVNLSSLLNKVNASFFDLFSEKQIHLQLALPQKSQYVLCDQMLMEKVIGNLLTNALKFSYPDSVTSVELSRGNEQLQLIIRNEGMGISEEDLPHIFDRFYQSANNENKSEGSGIGLSISKAILDRHGFEITVKSDFGVHATFQIDIPIQSLVEVPVAIQNSPTQRQKMGVKPSILLVEDHAKMRAYIKSLHFMSGYTLVEAANGNEALDALQEKDIDLLVSDFMMPGMDGMELVSEVKAKGLNLPIIILTAQASEQNKVNLLRLGIDGYLTKPFLEEELELLIKRSLEYDMQRKSYLNSMAVNNIEPTPVSELEQFGKDINKIIQDKLADDDLNLAYLCENLYTTERTLFRKVRELTGATPAKLIQEARMRQARAYYENQSFTSIKQLALAVGFKNTTRFSKKFSERFGINLNAESH